MLSFETNCMYTQAHGCRFCLHVGSVAVYFGTLKDGRGPRIEILTPKRWFRYSPGYRQATMIGEDIVGIGVNTLRELHRKVGLSNWLIEYRCHVIEDSCIRPDSWVCVDVDGDVVGRGRDYYEAIQRAKDNVERLAREANAN